jgi:glutamate/tyrosine decarboxylase-like PLP-dependent enzyme
MQDNFPYPHPFYLGQMLKPPHPIAQLAYALAMQINPNNHAHDGGRASSQMERECVDRLAAMTGFSAHLGHLCGGGTMANFEALWVGRELRPGAIAASSQSHYTHERLSRVLQVPFRKIAADALGRMDLADLERQLAVESIGTVVATLGTTGLGAVDPLDRLLELRECYGFRLHVDAAYGGYFCLARTLRPSSAAAFQVLGEADSLAIDPHKHGLQPYGCGCVLFRDPQVARVYRHDSPYTYFTSDELHLGEISLECSRAGAAAVALWATLEHLPLTIGGEFAQGLERGRAAALQLHNWLRESEEFLPVVEPELDIVVWICRAPTASAASARAKDLFHAAASQQIHLALVTLPRSFLERLGAVNAWDQQEATCLRACLMKPEHLDWLPEITRRFSLASAACGRT